MKTQVILMLAGLLVPGTLRAETQAPRHQVEEHFFGSSPTAYAILRTETEPGEGGGKTRRRTWLDEYAKSPVALYKFPTEEAMIVNGAYTSRLERSILLLEVLDDPRPPGDADTPADEAGEAGADKESVPSLAELLRRYPRRSLVPWSAEQMGELKHHESSLFIHYKNQTLVSGQAIRARMGGQREGDAEVLQMIGPRSIDSIAEDGNCAYVTLSAATDERKQTRVFCMIPAITRNIHALRSREALYLSAGRFDTREEALRTAGVLRGKMAGKPGFSGAGVEVWAHDSTAYSRTFFHVVVTRTMDLIRKRRVGALEVLTDSRFFPMPSDSFSVLIDGLP